MARQLGVGWHTVLRAVRDYGEPLVDDPNWLADGEALGVDEHVWCHPGPGRPTRFATGIVDVTRGRPPRLLDVVPGCSGKVDADWIAERQAEWRQRVQVAALDPVCGYATALAAALPDVTRVLGRLPSRPGLPRGNLTSAHLICAQLVRANLATAKNLTQQQLGSARGNEDTKLPAGRQRPAHWSTASGTATGSAD